MADRKEYVSKRTKYSDDDRANASSGKTGASLAADDLDKASKGQDGPNSVRRDPTWYMDNNPENNPGSRSITSLLSDPDHHKTKKHYHD